MYSALVTAAGRRQAASPCAKGGWTQNVWGAATGGNRQPVASGRRDGWDGGRGGVRQRALRPPRCAGRYVAASTEADPSPSRWGAASGGGDRNGQGEAGAGGGSGRFGHHGAEAALERPRLRPPHRRLGGGAAAAAATGTVMVTRGRDGGGRRVNILRPQDSVRIVEGRGRVVTRWWGGGAGPVLERWGVAGGWGQRHA